MQEQEIESTVEQGEPQNPGTSSFFSVPLRLRQRPLWEQFTSPLQSLPRRVAQATALSRQCRWTVIVLSDRGESNSTSIVALPSAGAHRTPQSHWRSKAIASGTRKRTIHAVMGRWIAPPTVPPADNLLPQAGKDGLAGRPTRRIDKWRVRINCRVCSSSGDFRGRECSADICRFPIDRILSNNGKRQKATQLLTDTRQLCRINPSSPACARQTSVE